MQIDRIAAVDKNNETALYEARIAHILQLFRLSHPNIPLHRLPAHGLKRDPNIQDYPLDFLLAYLNYRYSHRPNSLSITCNFHFYPSYVIKFVFSFYHSCVLFFPALSEDDPNPFR